MSQQARRKAQTGASRRMARKEAAQKQARQKRMMRMVAGAGLMAIVVVVALILLNRPEDSADADYSGLAFSAPQSVSADATADAASPLDSSRTQQVTGAVLGDPNAPVTMVVYADFQCPFCGDFARDIQPRIVEDFVKPGKVKLEFREFPFLGGDDLADDENESAQSAEAVMCGAEQDAYLDYHETLYDNQSGENQGAFSDSRLKEFAKDLGLEADAFSACLDSGENEPTITRMKTEGQALGITGTPTFVINGQVTSMTAQGYDLLKKQLNAAVEQAE